MNIFTRFKSHFTQDDGSGYRETSEKKTTILGYFLLFVMFIFLVIVGQSVFDDLSGLVERPERPTDCARQLVQGDVENFFCNANLPDCGCDFSDLDQEYGIADLMEQRLEPLTAIGALNQSIYKIDDEIIRLERQYELGLSERTAGLEPVPEMPEVSTVEKQRAQLSELRAERAVLISDRDRLVSELESQLTNLETAYDAALDEYERELVIYKLIVFLLSLLFIVPVFIFALQKYLKAKRADSPYTIIFTAFMAAAAVLLLQVVLVFLFDVLPLEWLEEVLSFLAAIPFFRFVFYYALVAVVVALFGGIVFFIQRRIFNEKRVALRRLKKNECPRCTFTIHHRDKHCPSCGLTLREPCQTCGEYRSAHTKYCSHCAAESKKDT